MKILLVIVGGFMDILSFIKWRYILYVYWFCVCMCAWKCSLIGFYYGWLCGNRYKIKESYIYVFFLVLCYFKGCCGIDLGGFWGLFKGF